MNLVFMLLKVLFKTGKMLDGIWVLIMNPTLDDIQYCTYKVHLRMTSVVCFMFSMAQLNVWT